MSGEHGSICRMGILARPLFQTKTGRAGVSILRVALLAHGIALAACLAMPSRVMTQPPSIKSGDAVRRDVREIYDRGLQFLVSFQTEAGDWKAGGQDGPGATGMALIVLLASGEDPNFGLYSNPVRKALRSIISQQNAATGFFGNSRYHHSFAMLALAEAYGAEDDRNLWTGSETCRWNWRFAPRLHLRMRTRSERGGTRPTATMPTPRSAARCWSDCWPRGMPESKFPMK